jgi:hypothetical protein
MVELIYPGLNSRFNIRVTFTANYFFVEGDIPVDNKTFLVTYFMNLKIKPAQYFKGTHRDKVYVHIFTRVSAHTCINIYIYTVFLNKFFAEFDIF